MRDREKWSKAIVPPDMLFAVRLDGCKFSGWTGKLHRREGEAFNADFFEVMVEVTRALVHRFGASTGYTHSDEITLVFPPQMHISSDNDADSKKTVIKLPPFGGKVQKLVSVTAAYATMVFNERMQARIKRALVHGSAPEAAACRAAWAESRSDKDMVWFTTRSRWFDARVVVFPQDEAMDICNYFIWRQRDCTRNCVDAYFRKFVGKKRAYGLHTGMKRDVLAKETQVVLPADNHALMIGTFLKRVSIQKPVLGVVPEVPEDVQDTDVENTDGECVWRNEFWGISRPAKFGPPFYAFLCDKSITREVANE